MKKKNHRGKYWKGIPEELKLMCLAEVRGTGHYCTRPVLKYLLDHMNECDTYVFGTMPYEVIRWIDTAVEMCLFPLEQHEKDWTESLEDIRQVLYRSEELLKRVAPADYREGYRTSYDNRYECNVIEYAQKLDVYFCVLYMFSEEWDKLQERLKLLLTDTEQNVRHMLSDKDAEKYAAWDDWAEYHYAGTDVWEPINWLCREFLPGGNARKLFARTYQEYATYLADLEKSYGHSAALMHLRTNAERRLKHICDLILDEICDEKEDAVEDDKQLLADEAEFEEMLQLSDDRCCDIGNAVDNDQDCGKQGVRTNQYYHKKWRVFTEKLHSLMNEYPTLPVVFPCSYEADTYSLDCSIGYVHDHETGEFKEKIIAVHSDRTFSAMDLKDVNIELPF